MQANNGEHCIFNTAAFSSFIENCIYVTYYWFSVMRLAKELHTFCGILIWERHDSITG